MLTLVLQLSTLIQSPLSKSTLAGNVNFDPLNLASKDFLNSQKNSDQILHEYREAELKHGRLAMLAAVAYPTQELVNPVLSKSLNLPNELADMKLSPSLLNGNLQPSVLIFFLGLAAGLELFKMNQEAIIPGDYSWRFTDAKPGTSEFNKLQEGEIWNGRLAMVAVLGYVVQEALNKMPVLFNQ